MDAIDEAIMIKTQLFDEYEIVKLYIIMNTND